MYLLQLFISYFCGLLLLLILGGIFNVTNKLYIILAASSVIAGTLIFAFSAIGYKVIFISSLSYFLCGLFGIAGFMVVIILKLLI